MYVINWIRLSLVIYYNEIEAMEMTWEKFQNIFPNDR